MKNTLIKKNKEKHLLAFETPVYYTKTTFSTEQIPTEITTYKTSSNIGIDMTLKYNTRRWTCYSMQNIKGVVVPPSPYIKSHLPF